MIREEMPDKRVYTYASETGDAQIVVYRLFPGIEVAYIMVHMEELDLTEAEQGIREAYVGFHYCSEGRIEQQVGNEFFYLMPGDCSVVLRDKSNKQFRFPLGHYHGISIGIDVGVAQDLFAEFMGSAAFSPYNAAKRLCGEHYSALIRSSDSIRHVFAESYSVDESQRANYLKVKLLELIYILNRMADTGFQDSCTYVPRTQAEVVKQAAAYIAEHLNEKLPLKELSTKFGVSETYLQNSFKAVYGTSVSNFVRMQKMQCAAQVLIHSSRSVDDIADEFGYINESKFSAAFKRIMGDSPSTYRREHSKIRIL